MIHYLLNVQFYLIYMLVISILWDLGSFTDHESTDQKLSVLLHQNLWHPESRINDWISWTHCEVKLLRQFSIISFLYSMKIPAKATRKANYVYIKIFR